MTDLLRQLSTSLETHFERASNQAKVTAIESKAGLRFPPLFRQMLADYDFEPFELGEVEFFGNNGSDAGYDIQESIFIDPALAPALLKAGLLQVGRPATGSYDPICFNIAQGSIEPELVQVDHESILSFASLRISKVIAGNFADLIKRHANISKFP
jgi:hypothetical protein